jgi:hypothetical protein
LSDWFSRQDRPEIQCQGRPPFAKALLRWCASTPTRTRAHESPSPTRLPRPQFALNEWRTLLTGAALGRLFPVGLWANNAQQLCLTEPPQS